MGQPQPGSAHDRVALSRWGIAIGVTTLVWSCGMLFVAPSIAPPVTAAELNAEAEAGATAEAARADQASVRGVVRYLEDAKRPWRYGRFYVSKDAEKTLSSALVCLRGRTLRGVQPREKPAVLQVDQQDYRFIPETVAIREGDQIRFTNSDAALHNVRSVTGDEAFNVSLLQDGEFLQTFRRAGNSRKPIRIGCAFHSQMQAWIYVFDHPFYSVTAEDGKFAFDGVPPGDYDLEVIHPSGELRLTRAVSLKAGQTLNLDLPLSPQHLEK